MLPAKKPGFWVRAWTLLPETEGFDTLPEVLLLGLTQQRRISVLLLADRAGVLDAAATAGLLSGRNLWHDRP